MRNNIIEQCIQEGVLTLVQVWDQIKDPDPIHRYVVLKAQFTDQSILDDLKTLLKERLDND